MSNHIKLRDITHSDINWFNDIRATASDEGMLITEFESFKGKHKLESVYLSKKEALALAEFIKENFNA